MSKIKIVCPNATAMQTQILTEDGTDISRYVNKVVIEISAGGIATATLTMTSTIVDVLAERSTACQKL